MPHASDEDRVARAIGRELDRRASRDFWKWVVLFVAVIIGGLVLSAAYTAAQAQ